MKETATVSLAPMMDRTTLPFRYLARLLYPELVLYTEMINAEAIIHGDHSSLLQSDPIEPPLVLQMGCSQPEHAFRALRIANAYPFSAYNLNVGCPSDRVQHRLIGAALMAHPKRVVDILSAMREGGQRPVTIKQRIGIQGRGTDLSRYQDLFRFTQHISPWVDRCVVHARIAVLEGLSPKENREVPPLRYHDVVQLQRDFPHLAIELNGGIASMSEVAKHSQQFAGVMLGRWPWDDSWSLARLGLRYGSTAAELNRHTVVQTYLHWLDRQELTRYHTSHWLCPLHNLFHRQPGSRRWRQTLSWPQVHRQDPRRAIEQALAALPTGALHQTVAEDP